MDQEKNNKYRRSNKEYGNAHRAVNRVFRVLLMASVKEYRDIFSYYRISWMLK